MEERVGDMYEETEKRNVKGNINPNAKYNEVNMMKERVGD
jgi:hypothetical protein